MDHDESCDVEDFYTSDENYSFYLPHEKEYNAFLKYLNCKRQHSSPDTIKICDLLKNSLEYEYDVRLRFSMKEVTLGDEGEAILLEALPKLRNLSVLSFEHCNLGEHCITSIASALKNFPHLIELEFDWVNLGDKGAVAIASGLLQLPNLERLLLQHIDISDEGAIAISQSVKTLTNLRFFIFEYHKIGTRGAVAMMGALKNLRKVETLWLRNICMGSEAALQLASAMTKMTNLDVLEIRDNEIGDKAMMAICRVVSSIVNMRGWLQFGFYGNNLSEATYKVIRLAPSGLLQATCPWSRLTHKDIQHRPFDDTIMTVLLCAERIRQQGIKRVVVVSSVYIKGHNTLSS
eukprot:m.3989 g.3989  ORF g.3989 m.3989 type:complete len:348 (+) comp2871_c0_seq2:139-1182(+)